MLEKAARVTNVVHKSKLMGRVAYFKLCYTTPKVEFDQKARFSLSTIACYTLTL
jgi:hypothetical protein